MFGRRGQHRRHRRPGRQTGSGTAAAAIGAVAAGALATGIALTAPASGTGSPAGPARLDDASPVALHTGQTCSSLLDHYRSTARDEVTAWGLGGAPGYGPSIATMDGAAAEGGSALPTPRQAVPQSGVPTDQIDPTRSQTGTTVQVAGVDEADLAKRSGDLLLALRPGLDRSLHVLRTEAGTVRRIGDLKLPGWPTSMLVEGDTVLLIGSSDTPFREVGEPGEPGFEPQTRSMIVPGHPPSTRIDQVDISDPTRPRLVASLEVAATVARRPPGGRGGPAGPDQLAIAAVPAHRGLAGRGEAAPGAQPADRRRLHDRGLAAAGRLLRPGRALSVTEPLVDCADTAIPARPAGVSTLTLLSADLRGGGLADRTSSAVVASGSTVYADAEQTVVTTPQRGSTAVHLFARNSGRRRRPARLPGERAGHRFGAQPVLDRCPRRVPAGGDHRGAGRAMPPAGADRAAGRSDERARAAGHPARSPAASQSRVTVLRRDGARMVESRADRRPGHGGTDLRGPVPR